MFEFIADPTIIKIRNKIYYRYINYNQNFSYDEVKFYNQFKQELKNLGFKFIKNNNQSLLTLTITKNNNINIILNYFKTKYARFINYNLI